MKEKFKIQLSTNSGFRVRAIVVGVVMGLLLMVLMYYMTMQMGFTVEISALAALISIAILPIFGGKTNKYEVNLVQTISSAVAMLSFPLSAFYIAAVQSGESVNPIFLTIIIFLAGIIGIAMNTALRAHYVNDPSLPFPIPQYVTKVIERCDKTTKKETIALFIGILCGILFAVLQDLTGIIPNSIQLTSNFSLGINLTIGFIPLSIALGYFIGFKVGIFILIGTVVSNVIIAPIATQMGWIENPNIAGDSSLTDFNLSLFLGLAVAGTFALIAFNSKKFNFKFYKTKKGAGAENAENTQTAQNAQAPEKALPVKFALILGGVAFVILTLILAIFYQTNPLAFAMSLAVGLVVIYIYTRIQAQTGMGVQSYMTLITFIITMLLVKDPLVAIIIITVVACVGSLSGDTINDFKTGQLLGADPKMQYIGQYIGLIPGAIGAVVVMGVMVERFGYGADTGLYPAAQLYYATSMSFAGFGDTVINISRLLIGAGAGIGLAAFGIPAAVIGMSMYLGMSVMTSAVIGSVIRHFIGKKGDNATNIATSFFAGLSVGFSIIVSLIVIIMLVAG